MFRDIARPGSWPQRVIDDILEESLPGRHWSLIMPHVFSILRFAMLALLVLATSWTLPARMASIEQRDGSEEAAWVIAADLENLACEFGEVEDSDDPLASAWPALAGPRGPSDWRMTSAEIDGAGPPSVPIPPPWIV